MDYAACGEPLETKAIAEHDDHYTVAGYASVFDNEDSDGDIIKAGAFADSLKSRRPLLLYGHQMDKPPIGAVMLCEEDRKGLRFEATLPKDDEFVAKRLVPQMRRGALRDVSIGFKIKAQTRRPEGGRIITKGQLFEISIVNIGANPLAKVERVKSLSVDDFHRMSVREREAHLKTLGLSNMLAKHLAGLSREATAGHRRDDGRGGQIPDIAETIRQFAKG